MVDFYIHKYTTSESITQGIVAPHKYRHPIIIRMNKQSDCLNAWQKDKNKIVSEFVGKMKEIYEPNERIALFIPPTNTIIFLRDVIERIKQEFPNIIDCTHCFTKELNVSFGDERYAKYSVEQLASFIKIDGEEILKLCLDNTNVFIADDVHATGKSIELTKYLIKNILGKDLNFKSGVLLMI